VTAISASGINLDFILQAFARYKLFHNSIGGSRPAYIAEANEEDVFHMLLCIVLI
jgi:hypothetical protein